jgi:hypothetical protein
VLDSDHPELTGATIRMVNPLENAAETLTVDTLASGLQAAYADGVLTLSGTASLSTYAQILATTQYHNTALLPNPLPRQIEFTVTDGITTSAPVTTTVTIVQRITLPPELAAFTCMDWQDGAQQWVNIGEGGAVIWDARGLYGSGSATTGQVGFTLPDAGPWTVMVVGSTTQYTLTSGDSLTTLTTPVLPSNAGTALVRGSAVGLTWTVDTPYVVNTTPLFTHFCYQRLPASDLTASRLNVIDLIMNFDTLQVSGTLSATISNVGTVAVTQPFDVIFFDDVNDNAQWDAGVDTILAQTTLNELEATTNRVVQLSASGQVRFAGDLIYVYVDVQQDIDEVDETNNLYFARCAPTN